MHACGSIGYSKFSYLQFCIFRKKVNAKPIAYNHRYAHVSIRIRQWEHNLVYVLPVVINFMRRQILLL